MRHVDSAIRAGETSRIKLLFAANHGNLHQAARQFHRQPDGHLQAVLDSRLHQQAINHDFDRVILPLVELDFIFQIYQFAIYARACEAVLGQLLHFFLELAFSAANNRRQNHHPIFGSEGRHPLDDLLSRLPGDGPPAIRTVRHANRSEQEAKIIINFCNGSHCRPRTAAGGLLLDGN